MTQIKRVKTYEKKGSRCGRNDEQHYFRWQERCKQRERDMKMLSTHVKEVEVERNNLKKQMMNLNSKIKNMEKVRNCSAASGTKWNLTTKIFGEKEKKIGQPSLQTVVHSLVPVNISNQLVVKRENDEARIRALELLLKRKNQHIMKLSRKIEAMKQRRSVVEELLAIALMEAETEPLEQAGGLAYMRDFDATMWQNRSKKINKLFRVLLQTLQDTPKTLKVHEDSMEELPLICYAKG
eukprot:snap_masked-scaffold_1-processed-gene-26.37-mRNA-1 protein AED:1.00 eAED:1.00 QI:0/-1/0/0/-1/1/1/0/237